MTDEIASSLLVAYVMAGSISYILAQSVIYAMIAGLSGMVLTALLVLIDTT